MSFNKPNLLHLPPELQYLIIAHLAAPVTPLIPNWSKITGLDRSIPSHQSSTDSANGAVNGGGGGGGGNPGGVNINMGNYSFVGPTINIVRTGIDAIHNGDISHAHSHNSSAVSSKYYDDAKRNLLFRHHRVLPLMLVNRYFYATVNRFLRNPAVVFSGEQLRTAERQWEEDGAREDMKHLVVVTYHEDWRGLLDADEEYEAQRPSPSCLSTSEAGRGISESSSENGGRSSALLNTSLTRLSLLTDMTFSTLFFKRAANSIRNLTYLNLHINGGPLHKLPLKEQLSNIPGQFSNTLTHCYLHGNRISVSSQLFHHEWPNLKELFVDTPVIGLMQRDIKTTFRSSLTKFAEKIVERDNKKLEAATTDAENGVTYSIINNKSPSSGSKAKGKGIDRSQMNGHATNGNSKGGSSSSNLMNGRSSKNLDRTRIFVRIRKHHSTHSGPFFLVASYNSNRGITSGAVLWYPRPQELNPVDEDGNEDYYHAKREEWTQIEMDASEYHYAMEHGFFDDDSDA